MKTLINFLLDGISFRDLAGKRQPRTFAILSALILLMLLSVFAISWMERNSMMVEVLATPQPIAATPEATDLPATATRPVQQADEGCPRDPSDWSLVDVFISQNYKLIQPACVYDGLERSVSWALAIRQGYSRQEAARLLGFEEIPMRPLEKITALGNSGKPQEMSLNFPPSHPDLSEWRVDAEGNPAVSYGLRGCFRTSQMVGNQVEIWGGDYAVICVVVEDAEGQYTVYALNGYLYSAPASPTRSYLLFGYAGDDLWVLIGTRESPRLTIDDPEKFANDRLTIATLYDSRPWEAGWLADRHKLFPLPLPESWQTADDEADMQAILAELNRYTGDE